MTAPRASEVSEDVVAPRTYSFRQRVQLFLITWAGFLAIRLIGPTLKYSISSEEGAPNAATLGTGAVIQSFWHRCVFPAVYLWRHRQIGVMTSQSFDGEYIARIIQKFGFVPVRGSSTRGGARAFLGMRKVLEQGNTAAFTIDGPQGPVYVAKPGPVLLARATGAPMVMFYIALENPWVLNTWDRFMIPRPFSKALMRVAKTIYVPPEAGESQMEEFHRQLQQSLERVRDFAEENVRNVGSSEFPLRSR
ncbi:MAG TPA: lysophospholipid acyltransferase family protein [Terriglobales bacterium]